MQKYNSRAEVPEEYKWDLTEFFQSEEEFEKSFKNTERIIGNLKKYKGCTKNAERLYEFLTSEIEAIALWEDLYVYSYLVNDQELGKTNSIIRKSKTENLNATFEKNVSFFEPELLNLSPDEYEKLYQDNPKLKEFKAMLDRIYREKEHVLTENEEKIITELTSSMNHFDDMSSTLLNSEHDYGKVKLEDGTIVTIATNNYRKLMRNKNVKIRKKVYNLFNKKIDQYANTSASLLNSYVSMNNSLAKIRHFKNSWEAKLFSQNLTNKVYDSLISAVEENLPSLHKYYELKKKALHLEVLHPYDLSLEMSHSDKEYSIKEAQEIIRNCLSPLGQDYLSKYTKIINNRYIDYCQYKGKCSGGYSFSTMKQNSRILMSYNGELDSVSTIAHESGHNVHHQYLNENNPLHYREQPSIVAEVASLTNECLLSDYISKNAKTKEEKLTGLGNIINVIVSNLFGAVREGKIEQEMYKEVLKGGTITKEYLDKKTKISLKKYYGPAVKTDKNIKNSWVTRSHYYMHFYLYSYAICISVATNVASKILSGDKKMLENYLEFLKVGSDKWPKETFAVLGIDLEDKNVYEEAIKYFDSLIAKYNAILDGKE